MRSRREKMALVNYSKTTCFMRQLMGLEHYIWKCQLSQANGQLLTVQPDLAVASFFSKHKHYQFCT